MPENVAIVVVFYLPAASDIESMAVLSARGCNVVAVVNAIAEDARTALGAAAPWAVILNQQNLGLAIALNQGCQLAFEKGATHVLLLDQDSRPSPTLATELLSDWQRLTSEGLHLGAIGPALVDKKGEITQQISSAHRHTIVKSLATSGTMISKDAFDEIGPMDEWLFIDGIDHEWCFRASHCGRHIMRMEHRTMLHDMGDSGVTFFGRYRPIHRSPIRHHYIIRNTIYLMGKRHIDFTWKLSEALKTIYRIPIYFAVSANRRLSATNIFSGIRDGVKSLRAAS